MRLVAMLAAGLALTLGAKVDRATVLDSQYVLQRYSLALLTVTKPKVMVFDYNISQLGFGNIEERHVLYRSGTRVRDETVAANGATLRVREVTIERRRDPYAVARMAPRLDDYQLLFLRTVRDGKHLDYVYDASPLVRAGAFSVDRLTVDGVTFLPRELRFHSAAGEAGGIGTISYAKVGAYWVPTVVSIEATVNGKPAREEIAWSNYRFPAHLPASTFLSPKPLPSATLPPF